MSDSKYDVGPNGRTYGYDKKGGWDIDISERTQRTSDSGHIPGRYQWEETIDVSKDEDDKEENQDWDKGTAPCVLGNTGDGTVCSDKTPQ